MTLKNWMAAALALVLAAPVALALEPPNGVIEDIYARKITADKAGNYEETEKIIEQSFTPELFALYVAAGETSRRLDIPVIDFDIFYDAQDWDQEKLTPEAVKTEIMPGGGGVDATVKVTLPIFEEQRTILYRMKADSSGGWAIDDIDYGEGFTLRKIMTEPQ